MRGAAQLGLDLGVPPRTARHRPMKPLRENEALYRASRVGAGWKVGAVDEFGVGAHLPEERIHCFVSQLTRAKN